MTTEDGPQEPAEHARFAACLGELEQVADTDEMELVGAVLADPDRVMAEAAVVRHLDRRAAQLWPKPAWEEWAAAVGRVVTGRPFLVRRLQEWSLFRSVSLQLPWRSEDLLVSSDWLQLKTAAGSSPDALDVLAESGRTKRIRNAARASRARRIEA
ncbi:hypothetical protein A4E84_17500 [Streptomyces qaidamensis]|uniref:Uncharacterized protein n=1 Tax=Streptomyces qaidamensis TaxID=1783515 RepID=A0A143C232_9ACTN|nr:hypothetical protein [Streptomyces qaidamensis]AMW11139.1 hypothetical protein A4E84_17500 [Streptomyces qaidamensis]